MNKEYYSGAGAIADYLRPTADKYIPLVELPAVLNPYLEPYDIHIDAKLMNTLPLGNVKSLPAWQMLEDMKDGAGRRIVEASSGNTVMSLGVLGRYFGAHGVTAIASPDVSEGKLALLKLAGVEVELVKGPICPDPRDPNGAIAVARQKGALEGHINLGQYDNRANPRAHERITGPQLYAQLGDSLGMLCAGLGTTGTLLGTARMLRRKLPQLRVAGVIRAANNIVPGVRTENGLKEVSFEWQKVLTEPVIEIDQKESYRQSLLLIRHGLFVGPSAGFALAGTLKQLERLKLSGEIEQLRGKHVVFICPDSPFPYAAEYERVLEPGLFPEIKNAELRPGAAASAPLVPELNVGEVREFLSGKGATSAAGAELIDVREPEEFADHHLAGSINVPLGGITQWIRQYTPRSDTRVVFVCRSGNRSARATYLARLMEIDAYNMKGGTTEWSAKGYPRVKAPYC